MNGKSIPVMLTTAEIANIICALRCTAKDVSKRKENEELADRLGRLVIRRTENEKERSGI